MSCGEQTQCDHCNAWTTCGEDERIKQLEAEIAELERLYNEGEDKQVRIEKLEAGLTKRELLAAMAMQGLCANSHEDVVNMNEHSFAKVCVEAADALLEALEDK